MVQTNESESCASARDDVPYVACESPPEAGVFEFGLVMAGAVSAGAYSAGVLDFLIEALDAWEHEKERERQAGKAPSQCKTPPHRVRLKVIAGASAGSMNAAIASVALHYDFPHIAGNRDQQAAPSANPFYRAWVQSIDMTSLLDDVDLRQNAKSLSSVFDASILERITAEALDYHGPCVVRAYLDRPVRVILTQASLRGVPYYLQLPGTDETGLGMWLHKTYRSFSLCYGNCPSAGRPDDIRLARPNCSTDASWRELGNAALGSGAFPLGLPPRFEQRTLADLSYRFVVVPDALTGLSVPVRLKPAWAIDRGIGSSSGQQWFDEFVVDGGTMNNEPLDLARTELAGLVARNPRDGGGANRAIVMIDPFPDTLRAMNGSNSAGNGNMVSTMKGLVQAWKNQARFDPVELALALDEKIYSRYLIAPTRRGVANDACELSNGFHLACGALDGFGGFLHESFRHHDYLLGRRNCQAFLAGHFSLPRENPLFNGWGASLRASCWGNLPNGELPIIPLMPGVSEAQPLPAWPTEAVSIEMFEAGLRRRIGKLAGRAMDLAQMAWWKRALSLVGVNWATDAVVDRIVERVQRDLRERKLNFDTSVRASKRSGTLD